MSKTLLSITIPTYNRSSYLKENLIQLIKEVATVDKNKIEILITDNASTDDTEDMVASIMQANPGLITYTRNTKNLGWGSNFFKCFEISTAKYLYILSDDDLLYDGSLKYLLGCLEGKEYGIVFFHTYGFNHDYRKEYPGNYGFEKEIRDKDELIWTANNVIRMLSSTIINKEHALIDTKNTSPGNFAHLHFIFTAMFSARQNLYIKKFLVAAKRANSSNYNFFEVFCDEYWQLYEKYTKGYIKDSTTKKIMNRMLFVYYPYYFLLERLSAREDYKTCDPYITRFKDNMAYKIFDRPILKWPKFFALIWAIPIVVVGRLYNGELKRGLTYFRKSIFNS